MNIGFAGLLTLIFVIAKLTGAVSWSWWVVLCPVLIGMGVSLLLVVALAALALIGASIGGR